MTLEAFFLPVGTPRGGRRYCLFHKPASAARACVLYVHPFAEEMNKSRRMAALMARQFAADGVAVLQMDLHGCGDSSGDFGDASWHDWVDDVLVGCTWLRERTGARPWLWGLRSGCLLAAEAARRLSHTGLHVDLLWWAPIASGKAALQHFLRLKSAGELLAGSASRGSVDALRERLAAGESIEVGGYRLSSALASGLEQASLASAAGDRRLASWDVGSGHAASPAVQRVLAQWQIAGAQCRSGVVEGPAFWQTTEVEEAPNLIAASRETVAEAVTA